MPGERESRVANSNSRLIHFTSRRIPFTVVSAPPGTVSQLRATVDLGDPSRRQRVPQVACHLKSTRDAATRRLARVGAREPLA